MMLEDLDRNIGSLTQRLDALERRVRTLNTIQKPGNFTPGAILFGSTASGITQDASNLFWDDTNNRLGIGNAAPSGYLHIKFTGGSKIGLQIEDVTASSDTLIRLINPSNDITSGSYWIRAIKGGNDSFYVRGDGVIYTLGTITSEGIITSNANGIHSAGNNSGLAFDDRTGANAWQWYGTGDIARLSTGTKDTISITDAGAMNIVINDAVTNTNTTGLTLWHRTSGTAANGFGFAQAVNLEDDGGTDRTAADLRYSWATAASATRKARVQHVVYDTAAREFMRGEASGTAAMIGFLGAAAVVRQNITGTLTGATLAQLTTVVSNILTGLTNLGLTTNSTT